MKTLIKDLKRWLNKEGNSYAKAAILFGYKDGSAIRQWVTRESIPHYQVDRLKTLLSEKQ